MTARELVRTLDGLPDEQKDWPVKYLCRTIR